MITISIWMLPVVFGLGYFLGCFPVACDFWRISRVAERAMELADKAYERAIDGERQSDDDKV